MRIGFGYDIHRLVEDRKLVLGGIEVDYHLGLAGISDGDVVLHAVADAILGAIGKGEIGLYFPPDRASSKGIDSRYILEYVVKVLNEAGFRIVNVDITVVAEVPKISPYYLTMRRAIAEILGVSVDRVSVKAKSNEGLGEIGRGEAIAAYSVVLVEEVDIS